jgi:preprotein translocase subunit SecG
MMILIILLTILLIVDCLFLGLLILVQLPKKEAGIGMAFGSGATDALFGAGSGTALSMLTKYTAGAFFVLVFLLAILSTRAFSPNTTDFKRMVEKPAAVNTPAVNPTATAPAPATTNLAIPLTISTNTATPAVTPPTNAPAAPAK